MTKPPRRIAINFGGGYVPGLNAVTTGAVMAAGELGWEIFGIRDGYDGLLFPERYADGGVVKLGRSEVEHLSGASGCFLGTGARSDPFHVRTVNAENQVEEVDRSGDLIKKIRSREIEAVISVVGPSALSILLKLQRQGLKTIAVPKSAENDMAATMLSFGFNTTLSFATETIERARQAAESARRIGVVEVLGARAGWLALQAGIATCADAVLIPEIRYDLRKVAARLQQRMNSGRNWGLVVVAEGAAPQASSARGTAAPGEDAFRASLSPGATGEAGSHVIDSSGHAAERVALELQRMTGEQAYPLVIGQLALGGPPTAVDRQLGLAYGAAAVRAIDADQSGVVMSFQPPDLKYVPLLEAVNKVRVVPADSLFVQVARSLGISLGD